MNFLQLGGVVEYEFVYVFGFCNFNLKVRLDKKSSRAHLGSLGLSLDLQEAARVFTKIETFGKKIVFISLYFSAKILKAKTIYLQKQQYLTQVSFMKS